MKNSFPLFLILSLATLFVMSCCQKDDKEITVKSVGEKNADQIRKIMDENKVSDFRILASSNNSSPQNTTSADLDEFSLDGEFIIVRPKNSATPYIKTYNLNELKTMILTGFRLELYFE